MKRPANKQHKDSKLIDRLGGTTAVANALGFGEGGSQRVSNWRRRGIPELLRLKRPDVFGLYKGRRGE